MIPLRYLIRRLVSYVLTIFAAMTLIFVIPRLAPGNHVEAMILRMELQGSVSGGEAMVKAWVTRFGLDKGVWTQYAMWLRNLMQGDLGLSMNRFPASVQEIIANRLPWTIGLLTMVIILGWVIGTVLGAIIGWRSEHSKANWFIASIAIIMNQIPSYVLSLLLVMIFAFYIPIFPSSGGSDYLASYTTISLDYVIDILYHATLPALSVIIVSVGGHLVSMRSLIVNIKGEDFVRYAESRGIKKNRIMMKYAFQNALLPQVTGLAISLGSIASGSLIVEWIFSYPGIGSVYVEAISLSDYNVVQGITLLIIFGVMTAVLIIDLIYPIIDPRVRYGER